MTLERQTTLIAVCAIAYEILAKFTEAVRMLERSAPHDTANSTEQGG